jgi:hypothetical protein
MIWDVRVTHHRRAIAWDRAGQIRWRHLQHAIVAVVGDIDGPIASTATP